MGLDAVELVLEVEDVFSLKIPDVDAERIQTVGGFSEFVVWFSVLISLILIGLFTSAITRPFATNPHRNWNDFCGLSESVLANNFHILNERRNNWNSNDIWVVLRSMIIEQLGVQPNEVTREASFVKDLGCG